VTPDGSDFPRRLVPIEPIAAAQSCQTMPH